MSGSGTQSESTASCTKGNNGVGQVRTRRDQHPQHGDGRRRNRDEHERCRRHGRRWSERHQGRLVLHRAGPAHGPSPGALGAREQRARPDSYGRHRVRRRTHLLRTDRCYSVRAGHDPGGRSVHDAGPGRSPPATSLCRRPIIQWSTTSIRRLWRRTRSPKGHWIPNSSMASFMRRRLRANRFWPLPCTYCLLPSTRCPCRMGHSCSGINAPTSVDRRLRWRRARCSSPASHRVRREPYNGPPRT